MLPDLGRLALQHAHEEEEVPTGVLDSAIGKASKKRRWLSKWKQDEAERPQLEGLPLELRHMVTDQLVAKNAGDGVTLCAELEAWCKAHPIACTKPGLWQAAFEAAFGRLNPRSADVWLWSKAFGRFPPRGEDPLPWKAMFVEICKALGELEPEQARVCARMANWTDAQLDHYCHFQRPPYGQQTSAQKQFYALLELRGANFIRRQDQLALAQAVLVDYNVEHVRGMTRVRELDVDYVLPLIPNLRTGTAGSLLLRLVKRNSHYNPRGVEMVKALLEAGADPNGLDVHGHRMEYGTLHWAVRNSGNVPSMGLEQVKLLLAAGADPTVKGRLNPNSKPVTPRELAASLARSPGIIVDELRKEMVRVLDEAIAAREAAAAGAAV